jgi:outer membrane lipoprotein-sorting protein
MWKQLIVTCLLLSLVFTSGCVQTGTTGDTELENQAVGAIEKELEDAIDDMNVTELEDLLLT